MGSAEIVRVTAGESYYRASFLCCFPIGDLFPPKADSRKFFARAESTSNDDSGFFITCGNNSKFFTTVFGHYRLFRALVLTLLEVAVYV